MENNYRDRVLEFLNDGSEKSTSEIASLISRDFYFTTRLLDEMEKDKILIKTEMRNFTYWKINNGKEI
jgi:hypothetical protein